MKGFFTTVRLLYQLTAVLGALGSFRTSVVRASGRR